MVQSNIFLFWDLDFPRNQKAFPISTLSSYFKDTSRRVGLNVNLQPSALSLQVQNLEELTEENHSKHNCCKLGWKKY